MSSRPRCYHCLAADVDGRPVIIDAATFPNTPIRLVHQEDAILASVKAGGWADAEHRCEVLGRQEPVPRFDSFAWRQSSRRRRMLAPEMIPRSTFGLVILGTVVFVVLALIFFMQTSTSSGGY